MAENDEVIAIKASGQITRSAVTEVPVKGRDTMGVKFVGVRDNDTVVAIALNPEITADEEVLTRKPAPRATYPRARSPSSANRHLRIRRRQIPSRTRPGSRRTTVSDANRGPGYAGPTQADQRGSDRDRAREDAASDARPSPGRTASPSSTPSRRASTASTRQQRQRPREYASSTQVIPAARRGPHRVAERVAQRVRESVPDGSAAGARTRARPIPPGRFRVPPAVAAPTGGRGPSSSGPTNAVRAAVAGVRQRERLLPTPVPPAPAAAADAPGDGLPEGEQSPTAAAPAWEPVASRPKKPLKDRWSDFTAKLSGRDSSGEPPESDSAAAERVWASSAAAGGVAAASAASSTEEAAASPVDQPSGGDAYGSPAGTDSSAGSAYGVSPAGPVRRLPVSACQCLACPGLSPLRCRRRPCRRRPWHRWRSTWLRRARPVARRTGTTRRRPRSPS